MSTLVAPWKAAVTLISSGCNALRSTFWPGLMGSILMMPPGFVFRLLEMRVGHYGPKFAALWWPDPGPVVLLLQHGAIGWVSALPLWWWFQRHPAWAQRRATRTFQGAAYGVGYYLAVNAGLLPAAFSDPWPLQMGWSVVVPSLTVHLVYGAMVAWFMRPVLKTAA